MPSPPSPTNQARLAGAARGLSADGLIAVAWAGVALAFVFVALRYYARLSESRRLFVDDYWMLAALLCLVTNAILQTLQAHSLYYLVKASAGIVPAGAALLAEGNKYVRYEFAIIGLFWTVTWCVKATFLSLYWRLFDGLPMYRKLWAGVVVFTVLAYVGCWIASAWTCHPPSTYFHFGESTSYSHRRNAANLVNREMREAHRYPRKRHFHQLQYSCRRSLRYTHHGLTPSIAALTPGQPKTKDWAWCHIRCRCYSHCNGNCSSHPNCGPRKIGSCRPGCLGYC